MISLFTPQKILQSIENNKYKRSVSCTWLTSVCVTGCGLKWWCGESYQMLIITKAGVSITKKCKAEITSITIYNFILDVLPS